MSRLMVTVKAVTDLGLKRSQNEDSHAVWVPEDKAVRQQRGVLIVVADGMGGSQAGEVASRMAVETVTRVYREGQGDGVVEDLRRALEEANRAVHTHSQSHPDFHGMGTTCTALVVRDAEATLAHVGDSRAYLVRNERIRQLTQDHSLVAQLVQRQQLTPEEARVDPRRNVVTRSIGVGPEVDVDAMRIDTPLEAGDTLVLCSDGLHGQVTDLEIAESASGHELEKACRALIALANQRGGPDNITVAMARVETSADEITLEIVPGAAGHPAAPATGSASPAADPASPAADPAAPAAGPATPDHGPSEWDANKRWARKPKSTERKPRSRAATMMWLLIALIVLAAAVYGIAYLAGWIQSDVRSIGRHDSGAGSSGTLAWR